MGKEDPCYEMVEGDDLQQGDFIDNCPVFIPEYTFKSTEQTSHMMTGTEIQGEVQHYNVVIMSQSCDLQHGKLKFVLVCPHWSIEELGEQNKDFLTRRTQEEIRRGYRHGYHMLNACGLDERKQEVQIVEFQSTYSIPFNFLKSFASVQGRRLRLIPPYREKLSQAFGNFFMRVGTPVDIPSFR